MDENDDSEALSTSFLDVLCCGLGGAIILFLVFSVLPHKGAIGASGSQGKLRANIATTPSQIVPENVDGQNSLVSVEIRIPTLVTKKYFEWQGVNLDDPSGMARFFVIHNPPIHPRLANSGSDFGEENAGSSAKPLKYSAPSRRTDTTAVLVLINHDLSKPVTLELGGTDDFPYAKIKMVQGNHCVSETIQGRGTGAFSLKTSFGPDGPKVERIQ